MGGGILTQTSDTDGRACTGDLSVRKLRVRLRTSSSRLVRRFAIAGERKVWRYRLRVRTEPSQGSNPGSIPGIATNS